MDVVSRLERVEEDVRLLHADVLREMRESRQHGNTTVIFANLDDADFDALHAGKVLYSGSTGKGGRAGGAESLGPYLASFAFELPKALSALGWSRVCLMRSGESWIVRRDRRAHPKP